MTRAERRRLLDAERRLAFGQALSDLFAQWGYRLDDSFIRVRIKEDTDQPMRFAIDNDSDLANLAAVSWGDDEPTIALRRETYEGRVAAGSFDRAADTDDEGEGEVEVAPKPKRKPKPKPLTLPLTVGQKVVLRDGTVATVLKSGGRDNIVELSDDVGLLWAHLGRKNSLPSMDNAKDAVADA